MMRGEGSHGVQRNERVTAPFRADVTKSRRQTLKRKIRDEKLSLATRVSYAEELGWLAVSLSAYSYQITTHNHLMFLFYGVPEDGRQRP